MNPKILALLIILLIFFISVFVFAFIYYSYVNDDKDPFVNSYSAALYLSVTIQTAIGLSGPPTEYVERLRYWIMLQSFISYLITLGLVFILIKVFYEKDNKIEELRKIKLELSVVKKSLSKRK